MKPTIKPERTAKERAEEEALRRQHAANPIRQPPTSAINQESFLAILSLVARFKAARENQGLTLAEVAERMGIDSPALSRLETGKTLNPTLATLHKWAEALGQRLEVGVKNLQKASKATLAEKREEWLKALNGDDPHSIKKQLAWMTWNVAAYRLVNEARRLAPAAPEGGAQLNGLMHNMLDRVFFAAHAAAVRRLVDNGGMTGKRGVYSLIGLLDDMSKHSELFTRASLLAAEGLQYDFEESRKKAIAFFQQQSDAGNNPSGAPNTDNWRFSLLRHERIDRLTGVNPRGRKPGDVIPKEKIKILKEQVLSSCKRIKEYVDKHVAHAATPESRKVMTVSGPTLGDLWKANEILCRVASCVATQFLGDSFATNLAYPQFDQFVYIDRPLATAETIPQLKGAWEAFSNETEKWNYFAFDKSDEEVFEP